MIAPHLRGRAFHFPLEVILPALEACQVEVIDFDLLRARCPAEELHTRDTGPGDCVIFPNRTIPRIYCQHTSCVTRVAAANDRLRAYYQNAGRSASTHCPVADALTLERQVKQQWRKALEQKAVDLCSRILEEYHWPASSIVAESPVELSLPVERQHRYIFDLFDDDDVLWCASSVKCTGAYRHSKHFRSAARWGREFKCPGAFVCPNPFQLGSYSRSDGNIARTKFLVVESDKLNRDEVGAIFRWMQTCNQMTLRAVVDTGNRSLHGWFECPSEGLSEKLKIILTGFGCDPAMFRPAQPCRLPGVGRDTGRWQELLYLAPPSPDAANTNADGPPSGDVVAI